MLRLRCVAFGHKARPQHTHDGAFIPDDGPYGYEAAYYPTDSGREWLEADRP